MQDGKERETEQLTLRHCPVVAERSGISILVEQGGPFSASMSRRTCPPVT